MSLLEVDGLSKSFGGVRAAQQLTFAVDPGEVLGIIGPNGAGKTTMFNLITGFEKPDAGHVHFKGRPITGLRPDRVSRLGISRTFQIAEPMAELSVHHSVLINVLTRGGMRWRDANRVAAQAVEDVGLGPHARADVGTLTAAQRHQVEFAKALAGQPELVLLDEIAAGLWKREQSELAALIRARRDSHGTAFLVIEHKLDFLAAVADRAVAVHFGAVIASGTPQEVLKDPTVLEAYIGKGHADA